MPIPNSIKRTLLFAGLIPTAFVGAVTGFFLGMYAVNFLPVGSESSFKFISLVGWEAVTFLGVILGIVLAVAIYVYFIIFKKIKSV